MMYAFMEMLEFKTVEYMGFVKYFPICESKHGTYHYPKTLINMAL